MLAGSTPFKTKHNGIWTLLGQAGYKLFFGLCTSNVHKVGYFAVLFVAVEPSGLLNKYMCEVLYIFFGCVVVDVCLERVVEHVNINVVVDILVEEMRVVTAVSWLVPAFVFGLGEAIPFVCVLVIESFA